MKTNSNNALNFFLLFFNATKSDWFFILSVFLISLFNISHIFYYVFINCFHMWFGIHKMTWFWWTFGPTSQSTCPYHQHQHNYQCSGAPSHTGISGHTYQTSRGICCSWTNILSLGGHVETWQQRKKIMLKVGTKSSVQTTRKYQKIT